MVVFLSPAPLWDRPQRWWTRHTRCSLRGFWLGFCRARESEVSFRRFPSKPAGLNGSQRPFPEPSYFISRASKVHGCAQVFPIVSPPSQLMHRQQLRLVLNVFFTFLMMMTIAPGKAPSPFVSTKGAATVLQGERDRCVGCFRCQVSHSTSTLVISDVKKRLLFHHFYSGQILRACAKHLRAGFLHVSISTLA